MIEVPQNSFFIFTVNYTNHEDDTQVITIWTALELLDIGFVFEPLKGPRVITLNPGQTRTMTDLRQFIPGLPLTTFRYYTRVAGEYPPGQLWAEDYWDFDVIP